MRLWKSLYGDFLNNFFCSSDSGRNAMSQSSGYQYALYGEANNPLKNEPSPLVNGPGIMLQQNGMQTSQFNLTGM